MGYRGTGKVQVHSGVLLSRR